MFTHAITRKPGFDFADGLTTNDIDVPDYDLMQAQHVIYVNIMRSLGLMVLELDALPGYPDAYFVEDVAVVTPKVAVITRPGAPSRRGEEAAMELALAKYRPIARIKAPGTLDGGDVLIVDKQVFVGLSARTNEAGADQLTRILARYGYKCTAVSLTAGLHFKSSVNHVGGQTLLPEGEEAAANVLWVNGRLLIPHGYPQTKQKLVDWGANVLELDVSEAAKMDGGLTCMSLRF